jgi:ABC-2 type transport system ATP-binding protein
MPSILEADQLTKRFGAITALSNVSLSIPRGGVYGILGANGAGKSTFFRICLDLLRPSSGSVRIFGEAPGKTGARRRIGALIETPRYYPFLTATETLIALSRASGKQAPDTSYWLRRVGLSESAHRKVQHFSVGMKQRLGIAAALITLPELLILDEPTSGMDPAGILEMRALIRELAEKDGITILLASHQLDEVQRTGRHVAIFAKGVLAKQGRIETVVAGREKLRIISNANAQVLGLAGARGVLDGDGIVVTLSRAEAPEFLRESMNQGVGIIEAKWVGGDLEKLYLEHAEASNVS